MIVRGGLVYWTTDELAGSLIGRRVISGEGRRESVHRAVRRWALENDLRPTATTRRGAYLWPRDAAEALLDDTEPNVIDLGACPA